MSFIGSCSGIHAAKQYEKAKIDEINMTQNNSNNKAVQINKIHKVNNSQQRQSSFSYLSLSTFKNWYNPQPIDGQSQQIQSNNNNWSSNPIISSRFQQQTKHH